MNAKRLLKLAEFLDKLPRKRFDYTTWVGEDWKGAADLSCGTTACALGWATAMPYFRRLGLRLRQSAPGEWAEVTLRGHGDSFEAACEVFGLEWDEADYLFVPYCAGLPETATPKRVAKHIRDFVARGGLPSSAEGGRR